MTRPEYLMLPALAGMNRYFVGQVARRLHAPRTRGDEPAESSLLLTPA